MCVNVLLMVEDASKTLEFYQRLGFQEQMLLKYHGHTYFVEMSLPGRKELHALMFIERQWWPVPPDRQTKGVGNGVMLYIPVDDIEAVYERVVNHAHIVLPPRDLYYGRELIIADQDGYMLAFIQQYPGGEHLVEGMEVWRRSAKRVPCD